MEAILNSGKGTAFRMSTPGKIVRLNYESRAI
jgi:hypothetical protein